MSNRKLIWLINPYGNIPGEGWREYRFNMIGRALSHAGYNVRWFVAAFEHRSKTKRKVNISGITITDHYKISIIDTTTYKKHISLKRISFERNFAKNIIKSLDSFSENPDLLIFCEPAIFVTDIYKQISKLTNSPYIIDILDLWPEIFLNLFPSFLKKYSPIILYPLFKIRKNFFLNCIGFTAVTSDYLKIGRSIVTNKKSKLIYIGIPESNITSCSKKIYDFCTLKKSNQVWLIYAGTLGHNYDILSIISLAKKIKTKNIFNVKIIIAGDGELKSKIESAILNDNIDNLIYIGSVSSEDLPFLYKACDIAICSYSKKSFVSIPLKAYDYFYFGLPIINSLELELSNIVKIENVGVQYISENYESMLDSFLFLYNNPDIRSIMSKNAKLLSNKFLYENQYPNYVKFVDQIMKEKSK